MTQHVLCLGNWGESPGLVWAGLGAVLPPLFTAALVWDSGIRSACEPRQPVSAGGVLHYLAPHAVLTPPVVANAHTIFLSSN